LADAWEYPICGLEDSGSGKLSIECSIMHETFESSVVEVSSYWNEVKGKIVIGQDLSARNGAVFQGVTFLYYTESIHDFKSMLKHPTLRAELSKSWISENKSQSKVFTTRFYNQAST